VCALVACGLKKGTEYGRSWDSRCSAECEKAYRDTEERQVVMKKAGIEPTARRMCEGPGCDRPIPKWKNGRQVSSKVRFCSDLCRKRAAKKAA
jgi:hypothetical protein